MPLSEASEIQRLQEVVSLLQHDVEQLNSALTLHLGLIQQLEQRVSRQETALQMRSTLEELPPALEDRPPHY